jgi:hypothetical protein
VIFSFLSTFHITDSSIKCHSWNVATDDAKTLLLYDGTDGFIPLRGICFAELFLVETRFGMKKTTEIISGVSDMNLNSNVILGSFVRVKLKQIAKDLFRPNLFTDTSIFDFLSTSIIEPPPPLVKKPTNATTSAAIAPSFCGLY